MKIQCNCGAKYSFDVTPEMAANPIRFVCPQCGLDSSDMVNGLIRQELHVSAPPPAVPVAAAPARAVPVARIVHAAPQQQGAGAAVMEEAPGPVCAKHPQQSPVDQCRVCGKPICPKCMELFGYVCSPLCRARANSAGISVPVFAGQKSVVEARKWKIIGWSVGTAVTATALFLGVWFWYTWFGCTPKVMFSVKFPERSYSGAAVFAGKDRSQVVFLQGDTLARHETKTGKQVWSRQLLDRKKIAAEVQADMKEMAATDLKLADNGVSQLPRRLSAEELQKMKERAAASALQMRLKGESIWVFSPEKVTLFDWNTGKESKSFEVGNGEVIPAENEIYLLDLDGDPAKITRIDLATAKSETTEIPELAEAQGQGAIKQAVRSFASQGMRKTLDPEKIANQIPNMPIQAKIALPALLAARLNQERLEAELDGMPMSLGKFGGDKQDQRTTTKIVIPTANGMLTMEVELLESKVVERVAMKAAPAKSVLDGNLKASQSLEAANEMLNEMRRNAGGDKVREDLSRYGVKLAGVDSSFSWAGEVTGPPRVIPLKTVNVLVASKSIIVLDKSLKKLWQSALSYDVPLGGGEASGNEDESANVGPCVERKDTLYVFDEGVLSAFDLKTGNARWRLPTVGIGALYFDDEDMLYVNTTSAGHERIKYSRQIDVTDVPGAVTMKVDSKNGKVLWSSGVIGWIDYIKGKNIFSVSSNFVSEEEEALEGTSFHTGFEKPAYLIIRRINPKTGKEVWEHYESRAPLSINFEDNYIRLVFRKEVEFLKFPSLMH